MRIKKVDLFGRFVTIFDNETGFTARSGILDDKGKDTNVDPFMAGFPELVDIGIMGSCEHGKSGLCVKAGIQCYQSGLTLHKANMSLENYKRLMRECKGKVFQVALGGRGDPDCHEDFEEILKATREAGIVPNFTTSGFKFNSEKAQLCKTYCGAVAVSWYRNTYTEAAIETLIAAGVKTNIHYVLGNNTIDEAIRRLETADFPKGVNAVVFLLHKPAGMGKEANVLRSDDPKVAYFFKLVDTGDYPFKVGFDSCSIPAIINMSPNINKMLIDTCEGARFSMYISADMQALPCSFDADLGRWSVDLNAVTIQEAWFSDAFNNFRRPLQKSCGGCSRRIDCMGGCPIVPQIVLCSREERCIIS